MKLIRSVEEMQKCSQEWVLSNDVIGLVPTMGALHEGHLSLVRVAKRKSSKVVVSIFVNPTQFGPNEDYERYPRNEDGDIIKCATCGVDVVFLPNADEMYPDGFYATIKAGPLADGLCGARRPGHFDGVVTVVSKLFDIVKPQVAVFGEKDFQQLRVIEDMAATLYRDVKIIAAPIVRETDGLAMSSRNSYLNAEERKRATCLYHALQRAREMAAAGVVDIAVIKRAACEIIGNAGGVIDYVEIVDGDTLKPLSQVQPNARMLLAVFIGGTRLIDNILIKGYSPL